MRMRHRTLNDSTREVDIHDDLLPTSHDFILDIVQCRADQTSDKRRYTAHHVRGFLVCVCGGAQYKEGTDLWATKRVGMMPAPNFGRHLDKERFTRILRCLKAGPEGFEDEGDPWHPVRFMVGGYNKTRRRNFQWGWTAVIDETMFAWRGKGGAGGMPHLSYILHGGVERILIYISVSRVIGPVWLNTSPTSRMGHNMVQYYPPAVRTSIVSHLFIIKAKHTNSFVIVNTRV